MAAGKLLSLPGQLKAGYGHDRPSHGNSSAARALPYCFLLAALAFLSHATCFAGERVIDETMRLRVLRLAFQNARISALPMQLNEKPYLVKDPMNRVFALVKNALKYDHGYEVVGPAAKNEEAFASDVTGRPASNKRQVWMQLFRWRIADSDPLFVAVLSYSFLNANPPRCCQALGKILLLSSRGDRILDTFDKVPYAFTEFTSIRFFHTDGTGAEKLMISDDFSGVGTIGVSSVILDVSHQHLKPLASVTTMILYEADLENADVNTLTLDERRTLLAGGKRFFFVQKSYVEKGKVLRKPVTSSVSFPVGTGLPLDWQ